MKSQHLNTSSAASINRLAQVMGVPPMLARNGGEPAAEAMAALGQARMSGGGGLRQQHLATAQHHIARLDPARHRTLVQHLQGHVLALQGRGADTKIAHVTPGEVVIPKRLQSPELMAALAQAARRAGIDPATLQVGARQGRTNPRTGHQEFDDEDDLSSLYDWDAYNAASQTQGDTGADARDEGSREADGIETITVTTPRADGEAPESVPGQPGYVYPMPEGTPPGEVVVPSHPEDTYERPVNPLWPPRNTDSGSYPYQVSPNPLPRPKCPPDYKTSMDDLNAAIDKAWLDKNMDQLQSNETRSRFLRRYCSPI